MAKSKAKSKFLIVADDGSIVTPEKMTDEQLAVFVSTKAANIAIYCEQLKPYYLALRERFSKKPKSTKIYGCSSWNDYCEKVLDRTKRAVNYFLAGGNPVSKRSPGRETVSHSAVPSFPPLKTTTRIEKYKIAFYPKPPDLPDPTPAPAPPPPAPEPAPALPEPEPQRMLPDYQITFTIPGVRLASVEKKIRETFGDEVSADVEKIEDPSSRPARLAAAENDFESAKSEVEDIRDELQNWKDNLPDNLQGSQKAYELDEAIEQLEEIISGMKAIDFESVNLPGMF